MMARGKSHLSHSSGLASSRTGSGSNNSRLSSTARTHLRRICFAVLMIVTCFVILLYIAKKRPDLLVPPREDGQPVQPPSTPYLDHMLSSLSHAATQFVTTASLVAVGAGGRSSREERFKQMEELHSRANSSLSWMIDYGPQSSFLQWTHLSNADVHIVRKLSVFLQQLLPSLSDHEQHPHNGRLWSEEEIDQLLTHGYQCTALQASQQELITKFITMDICSEIEWYKVLHLTHPEMKTFLDIGGNKGYLASLLLSLWGGSSMAISPAILLDRIKQLGGWIQDSHKPAGFCREGYNAGIPSYCPYPQWRENMNGKCQQPASEQDDLRVYSFDHNGYFVEKLTNLMKEVLASDNPAFGSERTSPWHYHHLAMGNKVGKARFMKTTTTTGAGTGINPNASGSSGSGQVIDSHNTIRLKKDLSYQDPRKILRKQQQRLQTQPEQQEQQQETEEVPMTTVDHFVFQEANLTHIDVLKINGLGHDNQILAGSHKTIKEFTSVFIFQGGKGVVFTKEMMTEFDSWGFNCYSTSRAGLFKWNGGCMKERYMGSYRNKDKGNIICIHRKHAPMAALAFEGLSFPVMLETIFRDSHFMDVVKLNKLKKAFLPEHYYDGHNKDKKDRQNEEEAKEEEEITLNANNVTAEDLIPLYISIRRFCKPYPACLALHN